MSHSKACYAQPWRRSLDNPVLLLLLVNRRKIYDAKLYNTIHNNFIYIYIHPEMDVLCIRIHSQLQLPPSLMYVDKNDDIQYNTIQYNTIRYNAGGLSPRPSEHSNGMLN